VGTSRFAAPLKRAAGKYLFDISPLGDVLVFWYHRAIYCNDVVIAQGRDIPARFNTPAVRELDPIINPKADTSRGPVMEKPTSRPAIRGESILSAALTD
jgi:hypothetical protein